jgi:hypothetical protein
MGSTALQLHSVLFTRGVRGNRMEWIIGISLAREVRAVCTERIRVGPVNWARCVLVQRAADGKGFAHLHVSSHAGSQKAANRK